MTTVRELAAVMLEDEISFTAFEDIEYLTTPVGAGAIEVEESDYRLAVYYRQWASDHGLSVEEFIQYLPEVSVQEQASFLRILIRRRNILIDSAYNEYAVYEECRRSLHAGSDISNGTAKAIAEWYDDGLHLDVKKFVSTGAITSAELYQNMFSILGTAKSGYGNLTKHDKLAADMLALYITHRRENSLLSEVAGWDNLKTGKS